MVDPIALTAIARAIAKIIFSKALEKSGEKLGEVGITKVSELLKIIREKFQTEGVEGKLVKAEADPNEKNTSRFNDELIQQMEDDEVFAKVLQELVNEIQSNPKIQIQQIFFKNVAVKGDAAIGNIEQITTKSGSRKQEAVTEVEVEGNFKIGDVKQHG